MKTKLQNASIINSQDLIQILKSKFELEVDYVIFFQNKDYREMFASDIDKEVNKEQILERIKREIQEHDRSKVLLINDNYFLGDILRLFRKEKIVQTNFVYIWS